MDKKAFKRKLWKLFSIFIRLKECLETTGATDRGVCCTCNRIYHYKELQAGHFIDGRGNSVLFDEDLVHIQCWQCNCAKKGNKDAYTQYMVEKYGQEKVDRFYLLKHMTKSLSAFELEAMHQEICDKIKELKNN